MQHRKAVEQIAVLDACLKRTNTPEQAERLQWLRQRILGAKLHIEMAGNSEHWDEAFAAAEAWTRTYLARATDMSTLGQLVSNQQMIMQHCVVNAENVLRAKQKVKFPFCWLLPEQQERVETPEFFQLVQQHVTRRYLALAVGR